MMMMKATKLGWAVGGQEKGWNKARAGLKHEQGRIRAGFGQVQGRSRAEQSKEEQAERGQELGRNWGGARNVPDWNLKGAG